MGKSGEFPIREASRAALVTALGLALPVAFHVVHLGSMFLPMFHPILAGAFFLPASWAALTGFATPFLSAILTGMPPLFPPVAVWMALELASMASLSSLLSRRTRFPVPLILVISLFVGRVVYLVAAYFTGVVLSLPPEILAGISFLSGWPGIILSLFVVPAAVGALRAGAQRNPVT